MRAGEAKRAAERRGRRKREGEKVGRLATQPILKKKRSCHSDPTIAFSQSAALGNHDARSGHHREAGEGGERA